VLVAAREDAAGLKQLVAYVVRAQKASNTGEHVSAAGLRRFLTTKLPGYMVPSAFVWLDRLPRLPNGKVDRRALPAPDPALVDREAPFVAPRTVTETALTAIWEEVLGHAPISIHDPFFELGGHSLKGTQIVARVRERLGVELPLRCLLEVSTVAALAGVIEAMGPRDSGASLPALRPVSRTQHPPLSFAQERVWFIQQLDPETRAYQFQSLIRFRGHLDLDSLRLSLEAIVRRHEILRTTFPSQDGLPFQVIHSPFGVDLPLIDLQPVRAEEREAAAWRLIGAETGRPFDLTRLPLVRWLLLRMAPEEHFMLHCEHHLVHDGWSFNRFLQELLELYQGYVDGRTPSLPALPVQYADYACWQRQWCRGELLDAELRHWKQVLSGAPSALELPTDHPRPAVQTFRGTSYRVELPSDLCAALRALSRQQQVTLFVTLLAGFVLLLHRYTGQDDLCIGTGMANRRWRETEPLLGMLVNTVVLRSDLSGDPTFQELLARLREVTLTASAHQDVPFEKLVEALQPERSPGRNPLFQVMFGFHDSPLPALELPGLEVELEEVISNGSAKFDLNLIVIPQAERRAPSDNSLIDGITLIWEYNTDLFEEATVQRMIGQYQRLLEAVVAAPEQRIIDLPLLTLGIDYRAPATSNAAAPAGGRPGVHPRSPVEEAVAAIWSELLSYRRVGVHDNFFELGGHSLLATRVVSRVEALFQVELSLRRLFETPTVAGLALAIAERFAQADEEPLSGILAELETFPNADR
jgi:acyl carrier protein